jgi:hypothetical protein
MKMNPQQPKSSFRVLFFVVPSSESEMNGVEEFEPLMNADERGWKCSVSMSWMSHCIAMAA